MIIKIIIICKFYILTQSKIIIFLFNSEVKANRTR